MNSFKFYSFRRMSAAILLCGGLTGVSSCFAVATNTKVTYRVNRSSGALNSICIPDDSTNMNWIVAADGSQYRWVTESLGWGLGYFTINGSRDCRWEKPLHVIGDSVSEYHVGDIQIVVFRKTVSDGFKESYKFTNRGSETVRLSNIGILTPFNDNYPDSRTCVNARCNAHVWAGGNSAYVYALRMGGYGPHLGLVVTEGCVSDYEIWERDINKGNSQTRGIIALCPDDMTLKVDETKEISWNVFAHDGERDFCDKAEGLGCRIVEAEKYVAAPGEKIQIAVGTGKSCQVKMPKREGEYRHTIEYGNGKKTFADFFVVKDKNELISERLDFILANQRMLDKNDERYGAFMIYDCEGDSIYPNDTPNCNPVDRDEGAERTGMGVFIAKYCLARNVRDNETILALKDYARFIRTKLQTEDYRTFSSVDKTNRNRAYNYAWVAEFYYLMQELTGDRSYALDGYNTLRSMYSQFGHDFYSIGIPVLLSEKCMKEAGLEKEWEVLKDDYCRQAAAFMRNGLDYPKSEVNYEQSIVAPVVQFLTQMYLLTEDNLYLDHVKVQMPVLEAFNGFQPSVHLNDIAIRHWDGYWFGKREMFGDVFPHYWSTLTASAFHFYSLCTGEDSWQKRAENIVENNLCLFMPDGTASCAYIYPRRVNGKQGKFFDPYANDQDWALAYYLQVKENIW